MSYHLFYCQYNTQSIFNKIIYLIYNSVRFKLIANVMYHAPHNLLSKINYSLFRGKASEKHHTHSKTVTSDIKNKALTT